MSPSQRNALLVLGPLALALLHLAWIAGKLPEQVPSHFDTTGQPDGWTTRSGLLTTYSMLQVGIAVLFLGLARLVRRLPQLLVNVPNKDYWFAGERRADSMDWLMGYLAASSGALALFMIGMVQLTADASQRADGGLDNTSFFLMLGGYLAFVLGGVVALFMRFKRRPTDDGAPPR